MSQVIHFLKLSRLDAFASPSQNVFDIPYLSRIVNETDPLCLGADFFEYNFNAYRRGGVIYAFLPRMVELTAVKHAMNFVPQRWLFIISDKISAKQQN